MSEVAIPYTKHEITPDDIQAVVDVLSSDVLSNGPVLGNFEEAFAAHVNAPHAVGVSSGTTGLHLAVTALGTRPEQTVIVPSLTFAATANAPLYSGANIEFVDIDPQTLNLDIEDVEQRIADNPAKYAGVIAVDFAGYPVDSQRLSTICQKYGTWLIEDAAHALGAVSRRHGSEAIVGDSKFADATVFSYHPAKHMTTGEGGMIATRDTKLDEKLRLLRSHAMDKSSEQSQQEGWYYRIDDLGYNYRMSEISAALGMSQLGRLSGNLALRETIAQTYREAFSDTAIRLPDYDPKQTNAYHLFVIRTDHRQQVYSALKQKGIFAQVHYVPLHMQPYYQRVSGKAELPHTEAYYDECLSIPMYPSLSSKDQAYVIESLQAVSQ